MTPTSQPVSSSPTATMPEDISALSPLVRWKRAFTALARVLANPDETDQVLVFSSYINAASMTDRMERFFEDPAGARLYAERRAIDSHTIDLDALLALPSDTLGHAYAHFLRSRGLTPEVFDGAPEGIRDPRAAYVIQRMRQTHDLWHVVTGAQTNPAGEVALQAFTFAQAGAASSGILAAMGTLRHAKEHRAAGRALVKDVMTMFRIGKRANKLAVFAWEDHWATPLVEVRAMLGLPTTPPARHAPVGATWTSAAA